MTSSSADLSRLVSHALRHEPWLYELELDAEGWVGIDQLVDAIRQTATDWEEVDQATIELMVASSSKRRHELAGRRIRALYGHSLPAGIRKVAAVPPGQLFHGTSPQAWTRIQETELAPMGRQYVHLSTDVDTALAVGRRKCPVPKILTVDSKRARVAGVTFYEGNERVWLADRIPPEFIGTAEG